MRPLSLSPVPFAPIAPVFSRPVAVSTAGPPLSSALSALSSTLHPLRRVLVIYMPERHSLETLAKTRVLPERTDRCVAFDATLSSLVQVRTGVARRMRAPSSAPYWGCVYVLGH